MTATDGRLIVLTGPEAAHAYDLLKDMTEWDEIARTVPKDERGQRLPLLMDAWISAAKVLKAKTGLATGDSLKLILDNGDVLNYTTNSKNRRGEL